MNRLVVAASLSVLTALTACSSTPAPVKGTIPPGTPPPDYEPARSYDPSTAPTSAPEGPPASAAPAAPPPASAAPSAPKP